MAVPMFYKCRIYGKIKHECKYDRRDSMRR